MANSSIYAAFERMWQHILNVLRGKSDVGHTHDVVSTTADGLAPQRDGSTTKFLRADGTWAAPPTGSSSNYGHVKLSDSTSSTSGASSGIAATPTAVKSAYDLANKAMPKSGGTFTGDVAFAEGTGIVFEKEGEQYTLMDILDDLAGDLAEYAMPKAGGQFTGTVEQYWEDTSVACIRGNSVLDGAWQPVSTCDITFIRK